MKNIYEISAKQIAGIASGGNANIVNGGIAGMTATIAPHRISKVGK